MLIRISMDVHHKPHIVSVFLFCVIGIINNIIDLLSHANGLGIISVC